MGVRLAPCPRSPNCVSSLARDRRHRIAPLRYGGDWALAMAALRDVLRGFPGAQVVGADVDRLHAVFTTRLLRFQDDVEFALDRTERVIHVRSASRRGYWDLGTNRRRVERVRSAFRARTETA